MKARILTDTPIGGVVLPSNATPDLPAPLAAALVEQGVADTAPEAVAYAEHLGIQAPALPEDVIAAYAPAESPPAKPGGKGG